MKRRRQLTILRWLCVLPAVVASFAAAVYLAVLVSPFIVNELLHWGLISLSRDGGPRFELLGDGPFAAILFVLSGAWMAPGYRRVVALALFCLGAVLTPGIVEVASMPLYTPSTDANRLCVSWAIASTYTGGALAVVVVFIATRRSSAAWSA